MSQKLKLSLKKSNEKTARIMIQPFEKGCWERNQKENKKCEGINMDLGGLRKTETANTGRGRTIYRV